MLRSALTTLLNFEADIDVVAACPDGEAASRAGFASCFLENHIERFFRTGAGG